MLGSHPKMPSSFAASTETSEGFFCVCVYVCVYMVGTYVLEVNNYNLGRTLQQQSP